MSKSNLSQKSVFDPKLNNRTEQTELTTAKGLSRIKYSISVARGLQRTSTPKLVYLEIKTEKSKEKLVLLNSPKPSSLIL